MQAEQTWTHTCRKKGLVRAVLGHPETDVTLVMLTQLHQELTQPALGADTAYLFDFIYTRAEQSRAEPGALCVQGDCICRHPRRAAVINEMLSLVWEQMLS